MRASSARHLRRGVVEEYGVPYILPRLTSPARRASGHDRVAHLSTVPAGPSARCVAPCLGVLRSAWRLASAAGARPAAQRRLADGRALQRLVILMWETGARCC